MCYVVINLSHCISRVVYRKSGLMVLVPGSGGQHMPFVVCIITPAIMGDCILTTEFNLGFVS